jgi:hypothetical protein
MQSKLRLMQLSKGPIVHTDKSLKSREKYFLLPEVRIVSLGGVFVGLSRKRKLRLMKRI